MASSNLTNLDIKIDGISYQVTCPTAIADQIVSKEDNATKQMLIQQLTGKAPTGSESTISDISAVPADIVYSNDSSPSTSVPAINHWSREAAEVLIGEVHKQGFSEDGKRRQWMTVSLMLKSNGFDFNPEQCRLKFKSIKEAVIRRKQMNKNRASNTNDSGTEESAEATELTESSEQGENVNDLMAALDFHYFHGGPQLANWSREALDALISEVHKLGYMEEGRRRQWSTVSLMMKSHGFHYTPEQCRLKLRSLKDTVARRQRLNEKKVTDPNDESAVATELTEKSEKELFDLIASSMSDLQYLTGGPYSRWSKEADEALLSQVRKHRFTDSVKRKSWQFVSSNLVKLGFDFSPEQCRLRCRNMKEKYHRQQSQRDEKTDAPDLVDPFDSSNALIDDEDADDAIDDSSEVSKIANFWSDDAVQTLVDAMMEQRKSETHIKHKWQDLAVTMLEHGYEFNGEQCRLKVKGIKAKYFRDKEKGSDDIPAEYRLLFEEDTQKRKKMSAGGDCDDDVSDGSHNDTLSSSPVKRRRLSPRIANKKKFTDDVSDESDENMDDIETTPVVMETRSKSKSSPLKVSIVGNNSPKVSRVGKMEKSKPVKNVDEPIHSSGDHLHVPVGDILEVPSHNSFSELKQWLIQDSERREANAERRHKEQCEILKSLVDAIKKCSSSN